MSASRRYTVLAVEDDARLLRLVAHSLSRAGFNVVTARDGLEGIERTRERTPDLIISDINMPEMDGFAFRDRLLESPEMRDVPFLFVTARDAPEDQIRGLRSGVDEYITKPFVPTVLVARVQAVLKRHESYVEMIRRDALTGLLNRPSLEADIERELERLKRFPGLGSLIFIDLDSFKNVNDRYGHAAGDEVLIGLARMLKEETRAVDIVGRFGGEEFVAYFPQNDAAAAAATVERLLAHFRSMRFTPQEIGVTFSAGIAEALKDADTFAALCRLADHAMYAAKKQGKDRIVIWPPEAGS